MNITRPRVLWGVAVVLLLLIIIWWRIGARDHLEQDASPTVPTSASNQAPAADLAQRVKGAISTARARLNESEKLRTAIDANNVPINFWGRVVDQDDNPLAGVAIKAGVREWHSGGGGGYTSSHKYTAATGNDGTFSVLGATGDVIAINEIVKPGYALSPRATREFNYARESTPTSNSPAVFRMWKQGEKSSLLTGERLYAVIPDGRIYTIDLLTGEKRAEADEFGDLQISVSRPKDVDKSLKQPFDWSFTVNVPKGGLLETNDEFMYRAPIEGYQSAKRWEIRANQPGWTPQRQTRLFLRSRDGAIYGRLFVEMLAEYQDNAALSVKYALNTNGLPNLE